MSTLPNQPQNPQFDAEPSDPSPQQPASESPQPEPEDEEEEGECGFCLFMKGGGCKDSFIDWENCVQQAEDNNEDLVEKCSQVTSRLKECMDAHSDYYEPILRAEKHVEEQAVIELEKEKQDSASNNDRGLELNATSTPSQKAENDQSNAQAANPSPAKPASEAPKAPEAKEEKEVAEDKDECGLCVFLKGGGCKDTFIEWDNCMKKAEENKEDLFEKCSQVTSLLMQCMNSHSDYYKPILMAGKRMEEEAVVELEKEKLDSATRKNEQEAPSDSNKK